MKRFVALLAAALVAAGSYVAMAHDHESGDVMAQMMAEMQSCQICSSMLEHPEMMEAMTWETHKIDNGMLCMASVPKDMAKLFHTTHEEMMGCVQEVIADSMQGKPVEICSFCTGMGDLMKAGAKQQEIVTKSGAVTLVTSSDPEVVKKIHAMADKSMEIEKAMEEAMAAAATH